MKVVKQVGTFSVEFERGTDVELFEEVARFQEVFDNEKCGKCESSNVRFVVREDKEENKYYELRCMDCGAKLAFGCHKKGGGLFPKRKDAEGNWKPTKGWVKYNSETGKEE
jgi:hypothetical protein